MTEKPIIFSGPMVRAILEGRKTQTRRVLKPQPGNPQHSGMPLDHFNLIGLGVSEPGALWQACDRRESPCPVFPCMGGAGVKATIATCGPGSVLWVRETWAPVGERRGHLSFHIRYKADAERAIGAYGAQKWRSLIHMPRWASRITLRVTDVRVQRVQEISEEDARAEGIRTTKVNFGKTEVTHWVDYPTPKIGNENPCTAFRMLWDSIHAKHAERQWKANPWVVAITFERG